MASGWGGLNEIIEEGKRRKEEEERERRMQDAANRIREAQQQGPRPEPDPLPNPWQRPVFSDPKPNVTVYDNQQPQYNVPGPYESPSLDTGAYVGSSREDESDTYSSPLRQQQMGPLPMGPRPMASSLSDRLRGAYETPEVRTDNNGWVSPLDQFSLTPEQESRREDIYGRRATPSSQPQPWNPLTNAWTGTQQGQEQGQERSWPSPDILRDNYNAPNRPIVPVPPRPMVNGQIQDDSLIGATGSQFWEQYKQTPEHLYAQQKVQDRQEWQPYNFEGALQERKDSSGEFELAPADYAWAGLTTMLNNFEPTRAIIRGGANILENMAVPWMAGLNAPLPGSGVSISEATTPTAVGAVKALSQLGDLIDPTSMANTNANLFNWLAVYTGQEIAKTQKARKSVSDAVRATGNPQLNMALRPIAGNDGATRVANTLDLMQNSKAKADQIEQQAIMAMEVDPERAGQLFAQAQELRSMSYGDMVDSNLDIVSEIIYGILDPTGEVIAPIVSIFNILPEARALAKARKAVSVSDEVAVARLGVVGQQGQKLARGIAEGKTAANQVYQEIIAPYQGTMEKIIASNWTRWMLARPTAAAQATQDAKTLSGAVLNVLSGITDKVEAGRLLDILTSDPKKLVTGVSGLSPETLARFGQSDGTFRVGAGALASSDIARRMPLLTPIREQLLNLDALKGAGDINPIALQAEVFELVRDAAQRSVGGKQPTTLPFGAVDVKFERVGADSARVVYLDKQGKVVMAGAETTIPGAQRQLNQIKDQMDPRVRLKDIPYRGLKLLSDVQRHVMNDVWLFARPANWAANALSASLMMYAHNTYTPLPLREIQDWNAKIWGGYQPTANMFNTLPGANDLTRTMRDEIGGSALGWLAAKATGTTDNVVTRGMKALQEIPYGTTEIPLPGVGAIPIGEEALRARAFYVPAKRVRDAEVINSVGTKFASRLQAIADLSPEMSKWVQEKVVSLAQNGNKADVMDGMRKAIGKPTVGYTLQTLGVPPELLLPEQARMIEQLLSDASPEEAAEVAQELTRIFNEARKAPASSLTIDPGQAGVVWTADDLAQEAGWLADVMVDDAVKAGLDQTTAHQQAQKWATDLLQEQQQTLDRVMQDFAPVATKDGAMGAVMDFYLEFMQKKAAARNVVDEAGRIARSTNTPEAWANKWKATETIYGALRQELGQLAEQARLNLQGIYNGDVYKPRYDWWETTQNYLNWSEEEFRAARAMDLGGVEDDVAKWELKISKNREMFDNSQYELLGAFQMYPTVEGFDMVREALRRSEAMGAQTAYEMAELRKLRATGAMSDVEFNKIRNAKWDKHFDDAATLNQVLGKLIVRRGITKEVASELRWVDNGVSWELLGPSEVGGKWRARNSATNAVEEFTVAQSADEIGPFVVPKNVVDDFNKLAGNDIALDKAADEVMQQIAESAPPRVVEVTPPVNPAPVPDTIMTTDEFAELAGKLTPAELRSAAQQMGLPSRYTKGRPLDAAINMGDEAAEVIEPTIFREPDVEPSIPGYNGATLRRREPLPQPTPSADDVYTRSLPDDPDAPDYVPSPAVTPDTPLTTPRPRTQGAYSVEPELTPKTGYTEPPPAPAPRQYSIPTNEDIRKAASDAGIATATDKGRPTDRHLVNSINKRLGIKVKSLDELTEAQRAAAVDAMRARGEAQVSKLSPAEAKAAASTPTPAVSTDLPSVYDSKRIQTRKQPDGQYKMYWIGTNNEIFPGELFRTPNEARQYAQAMIIKNNEAAAVAAQIPTPSTPTVGTGSATGNMFGDTAEDLPTISGAATRPQDKGPFKPTVEGGQESMFDMRPTMGGKGPTYAPKLPKEPKVTTVGDIAKMESQAALETQRTLAKEWDRVAVAQLGLPPIDQLILRYKRNGSINLNLDKGEIKLFEDLYGNTIGGMPIDNLDDVQRFFQTYNDLGKQVATGKATVAKSKEFSKMGPAEIIEATRGELRAAGLTDAEIAELATQPRRTILDTIESIRGDTPDEPGLVAYDFAVPSISHMLGANNKDDAYNLWKRITGRSTAHNAPPNVADVARVTIENLNDAERVIKSRLVEILEGKPNTLTGAQKLRVLDAVADWLPDMDNINSTARRVGEAMADHIMLNVDNRRDFDTLMGLMTGYHYFWSRMPSRLWTAAISKPSLVNFFYKISRAIELENEQSGVPDRLRGTVPEPGTNARINVGGLLRYAMGGAMGYLNPNPFVEDDPSDNKVEKWMKNWEKAGGPGLNYYLKVAADVADGKIDKYYGDILNSTVRVPLAGVPVSSVYQWKTGRMPAKDGKMASFGFGPDTTDAGFGLDAYRARRAVEWISETEGINDQALVGYANQVILNQYNGVPDGENVDPAYLDAAIELASRGVKQAAEDRLVATSSAYVTMMGIHPYTEAEQEAHRVREAYYASGWDPMTNPYGNDATQKAIIKADPTLPRSWIKSSETPGIDAQISQLYDEANANGNWNEVMPKIEALQEQKSEITGKPATPPDMLQPTPGSTSDILRGVYGSPMGGMTPQEQLEKQQEQAAQKHWDVYLAIPKEGDGRAQYLRDNPDFVPIYDANEVKKGREIKHWWEKDSKESKGSAAMGGGATTPATDGGLAPGSVTRDDFTEQELDQYYGEYLAFNGTKDWDGQKAWLAEHPEFARMEADRKFNKDGEYPWWYDDVLGGTGAMGAAGIPRPPSQPNSVADVLRQPYDYNPKAPGARGAGAMSGGKEWSNQNSGGGGSPWADDWDAYHAEGVDKGQYLRDHPEFAKEYLRYIRSKDPNAEAWWLEEGGGRKYGKGGGTGSGEWRDNWDEYHGLPDTDAKRKYLLDHPEFADEYLRYIREQDPEAVAWWLQQRSSTTYAPRSYSYGGGGGGGGGSPWLGGGGGGGGGYRPQVNPRYMNPELANWQPPRPWVPYSNPTPDWLRAGDRLAPPPMRKWERPRF